MTRTGSLATTARGVLALAYLAVVIYAAWTAYQGWLDRDPWAFAGGVAFVAILHWGLQLLVELLVTVFDNDEDEA